jgi:hypothetical protein
MSQTPKQAPAFEVPDLEVPGLELEPAPSKRTGSAAPEPAGDAGGLPELDLESGAAIVLGSASSSDSLSYYGSSSFSDGFGDGEPVEHPLALAGDGDLPASLPDVASPAFGASWPSGRTPEPERLELTHADVERAGAYGPSPGSWLASPAYAWRVARRQRALRTMLRTADDELRAAEAERDGRLAELVLELRPALEADQRFRRLLVPLAELERAANEQGQALSSVSSEYESLAVGLDVESTTVQHEIARRTAAEQSLSKTCAEREADWKRSDARLKRTNIEIRNLVEGARALGQSAAALSPDKAAELARLNERLALQKTEAQSARAAHDRAQAELSALTQELGELRKAERRIDQQRAALAQRYRKRLDVQGQNLGQTEARRVAALAEVGRGLLAARGGLPIGAERLSAVAEADRRVLDSARRAALLLGALDAYDLEAAKRGRRLAVFVAAMLLLWIAAKFAV